MAAEVATPEKVRRSAGNRGQGRKKGVPNKQTTALKDMILAALDGAGGIEYLKAQAFETPAAFMTLVGKVLPLQIAGTGEGGALVFMLTNAEARL